MWTYSSKQCLSLMAQINSFMTVNRKLTRFQMRVENKDYHQLLGEHLGPSIFGVITVSCIFRRYWRENTADCWGIPRTGGVRGGLEREWELEWATASSVLTKNRSEVHNEHKSWRTGNSIGRKTLCRTWDRAVILVGIQRRRTAAPKRR